MFLEYLNFNCFMLNHISDFSCLFFALLLKKKHLHNLRVDFSLIANCSVFCFASVTINFFNLFLIFVLSAVPINIQSSFIINLCLTIHCL